MSRIQIAWHVGWWSLHLGIAFSPDPTRGTLICVTALALLYATLDRIVFPTWVREESRGRSGEGEDS